MFPSADTSIVAQSSYNTLTLQVTTIDSGGGDCEGWSCRYYTSPTGMPLFPSHRGLQDALRTKFPTGIRAGWNTAPKILTKSPSYIMACVWEADATRIKGIASFTGLQYHGQAAFRLDEARQAFVVIPVG